MSVTKILLRIGLIGGIAAVVLGLVLLAAAGIYVIRVTDDLPDYAQLADYEPPVMSRVHAADGTLIAEYAREHRAFVPIDAVPPKVIEAFISAEDKNFYRHGGLDYAGIIRAAMANVQNVMDDDRLEGASTITQQVAKNFLLTNDQRVSRKVREMVLARRMERAFGKDKILELYLNEIYLGNRSYGVAAAALNYYGKPLDELTLAETAYLAALPKAPSNYHPQRHTERAIARRNWVIDRMRANNYVSRSEAQTAKREPLEVAPGRFGVIDDDAQYFAEEVRRSLISMYDEDRLYDGGLSVRTTLNMDLQRAARDALRKGLISYDRRHGYRGAFATLDLDAVDWREALPEVEALPDLGDWVAAVVLGVESRSAEIGFVDGSTGSLDFEASRWARPARDNARVGAAPSNMGDIVSAGDVIYVAPMEEGDSYALQQVPEVNGAFMAMDPHTGRVRALVGGFSFAHNEFNRATQASRQPGSSFKPIVYATALDNGFTPSTVVLDAPFVARGGDGKIYRPSNYSGRSYGPSTLRRGIEMSRNQMTVRLANKVSMDPIVRYAENFGVADEGQYVPTLAISLGAGETTLWRMIGAYGVFANGGQKVVPTVIDRIQDRYGNTIYRHDPRVCEGCEAQEWDGQDEPELLDPREQVIDPVVAYQITSMLEGVVERGTAARAVGAKVDFTLAGKTGTTNDFKDAWFVGFAPDLVAGVYVGFDQPQTLGYGEAGGVVAAPIFADFMAEALKGETSVPFRVPSGARLVPINPRSGARMAFNAPGSILEPFKPGTEPRQRQATRSNIRLPGMNDFGSSGIGIAGADGQSSVAVDGVIGADEDESEDDESEDTLGGVY